MQVLNGEFQTLDDWYIEFKVHDTKGCAGSYPVILHFSCISRSESKLETQLLKSYAQLVLYAFAYWGSEHGIFWTWYKPCNPLTLNCDIEVSFTLIWTQEQCCISGCVSLNCLPLAAFPSREIFLQQMSNALNVIYLFHIQSWEFPLFIPNLLRIEHQKFIALYVVYIYMVCTYFMCGLHCRFILR